MAVVVPNMNEIFEEAFERAGLEMRTGHDLKTARRSLNFLCLEWQNRGLNLFTIENGSQALTSGVAAYTMPVDTIDLIDHQLRYGSGVNQLDTQLTRISVMTYSQQAHKNQLGKPTQIYVARGVSDVTATLWPVPDKDTYTLTYYRLKGIDGLSSGVGTTPAVPPRFVPALVSGIAYHIAAKRPQSIQQVAGLKAIYDEQYELAAGEDEDRASVHIVPMRALR